MLSLSRGKGVLGVLGETGGDVRFFVPPALHVDVGGAELAELCHKRAGSTQR